ncbi:hypothetical protein ABBQ38_006558 [Trebouxia sp. C0009 RCD-2024]
MLQHLTGMLCKQSHPVLDTVIQNIFNALPALLFRHITNLSCLATPTINACCAVYYRHYWELTPLLAACQTLSRLGCQKDTKSLIEYQVSEKVKLLLDCEFKTSIPMSVDAAFCRIHSEALDPLLKFLQAKTGKRMSVDELAIEEDVLSRLT